MRSLALASIHPPTAKLVFHNAIRRVSVPASSASTDFSLSICTGRPPTMTHGRPRSPFLAEIRRPHCVAIAFRLWVDNLLIVRPLSSCPFHRLSLSPSFSFRSSPFAAPYSEEGSCDTSSTGTSAGGVAQFARLHFIPPSIPSGKSPPRRFTMYVVTKRASPRPHPSKYY